MDQVLPGYGHACGGRERVGCTFLRSLPGVSLDGPPTAGVLFSVGEVLQRRAVRTLGRNKGRRHRFLVT